MLFRAINKLLRDMSKNNQFPVLLNVKLNDSENHCHVKADITGFRASSVRVTPWDDSLIIEMRTEHEPDQSYYLGEVEPSSFRRVLPLGFPVDEKDIMTHYQYGKLDISIAKRTTGTPATRDAGSSHA